MKALIIEDEQLAADRLTEMVQKLGRDLEVVGQFDTVKETVAFLEANPDEVDILFCDIQLADGLSFNIFEKVEVHQPVVFTTAYDEYALRAFKINSLDYLLKPVRQQELTKALDKYQNIYDRRLSNIDLSQLKALFTKKRYKERFLVRLGKKFFNKDISEVTYFSSESKIVYLHDQQPGKKYMTDFTLDELMKLYLDGDRFFRINRQFIVHIDAIEMMKPYSNQRLILQLKMGQIHELVVSREKVSAFKEWFN